MYPNLEINYSYILQNDIININIWKYGSSKLMKWLGLGLNPHLIDCCVKWDRDELSMRLRLTHPHAQFHKCTQDDVTFVQVQIVAFKMTFLVVTKIGKFYAQLRFVDLSIQKM